jgi:hypothetical protein
MALIPQDAPAPLPTTTSLTQSSDSSFPGQTVTFRAVVALSDASDRSLSAGDVLFYDAGNFYGEGHIQYDALSGEQYAELSTSTLSGTQTFVAQFRPLVDSGSYGGSYSDQITHRVVNPVATIALSTAPNPSVAGERPITLTATVSANPGPTTPTGEITVYVAGDPVEGGRLDYAGHYQVDMYLDVGLGHNSITATYFGDTTYPVPASATLEHLVNQDVTSTTLSSSPNPSIEGQTVTFQSATSVTASGSLTPTGTVSFYEHGNMLIGRILLGTSPLDANGRATLTTARLPAGTAPVFAVYSGDTNCTYSASATVHQTVTPVAPK